MHIRSEEIGHLKLLLAGEKSYVRELLNRIGILEKAAMPNPHDPIMAEIETLNRRVDVVLSYLKEMKQFLLDNCRHDKCEDKCEDTNHDQAGD